MTTDSTALKQIRARLLDRRAELRQRRDQIDNDQSPQALTVMRELEDIELALERMSRGLYGMCKACGDQISIAHLAAVPHASNCQQCGE